MENGLQKKYGLFTAIAMVVGIVIGSGIFFKTESVLSVTGGNVGIGVLALAIVGFVMFICSYTFSILAQKYEKVNGIVDYSEAALGPKYAYYVGWFMTMIYYPTITSVLAWLSARYTCVIIGFEDPVAGAECMVLSGLYLIGGYAINALSPVLAGKLQISGTVIKLIPLCLMAVVGIAVGLGNGQLAENFAAVPAASGAASGNALLTASVALAFAYEGWIVTTSINAELVNAKRNLPLALTIGSVIVISVYICYYLGICGSIPIDELLATSSQQAFYNTFGRVVGSLLNVFIVISCLCTMNGLILGCSRGMYSIAVRGLGPKPKAFAQVDPSSNMPVNSAVVGVLLCMVWLVFFFGTTLTDPWFGSFCFDASELPIITLYACYIPIFFCLLRDKNLGIFQRYIAPIAAIACCCFMLYAAFVAHRTEVLYYLIVFAVVMAAGIFFSKPKDLN